VFLLKKFLYYNDLRNAGVRLWSATTASDSESSGEPMSNTSSRREFLATAAVAAVGLPAILRSSPPVFAATEQAQAYNPPSSPREKLNFNLDWRFLREDAAGAEAPLFDDAQWAMVSTPHTFNDVGEPTKGSRGTASTLNFRRV
jgi:beta-galactosidase